MNWSSAQIAELKKLYKKHSFTICAKLMNLTPGQVKGTLVRYNISSHGRTGKYEKGHQPFNAGKKGINTGGEAGWFKPGSQPHNTKHNGAISTRTDKNGNPHQFIRISKSQWEPLHKFNYTMFTGPIQPGNIVVFQNGDTMDPRPENLMQITRAEHAHRNRNRAKAAATLKRLYDRERIRKLYGLPPLSKLAMRIVNY